MKSLRPIIEAHPFFSGLAPEYIDLVVGCAKNVRFEQDAYLFREGDEANDFYFIRHGRVGIEMSVHHEPVVVHTVGAGEILGWSWLVPPHRWRFHARALQLTRAIALDGECLRNKCLEDKTLGYELLRRFAQDMEEHLYHAWLQIIDVYA